MSTPSDRVASALSIPKLPLPLRWLVSRLGQLEYGELTLIAADGNRHTLTGEHTGPSASIQIHRPLRLLRRLLTRGDIGFAEGYMQGEWSTPCLSALLTLGAMNEHRLSGVIEVNRLSAFMGRLRHLMNRNSKRGSRANISFHYDLGNEFYKLWLDGTMTYSSAIFAARDEALETAQTRKYQRLLDSLDAEPGAHILEIGCGWGGFAELAARQGYRVTGLTLSREQLAFAQQRIAAAGLSDRVDLRLQDYRDLDEQFDHVVSIEMFEAVGEQYWPTYFQTVERVMRPAGRAALQVITIDEAVFERYRKSADFIQLYIFPGGMLPSVERFNAAAEAAGLDVGAQSFHRLDYAETLARWHRQVMAHADVLPALGYDERFLRTWRYYLSYCEAGFRTGRTDLMQVLLHKPA
ncbi:SAM-dependent methyltransferase [Thioalkalivibrio sulfidiphilus]|uniref:SAM-dependent methyltransferase n=1 Tax=Thioalkalivibrio sulfidiphilus TaxID=1033854 RepID=UPI00037AB601|nr:cyclopropane-fatty-acyl-phospholipid synthase family protein [Thioalkalivibrio sulfidiphilus]